VKKVLPFVFSSLVLLIAASTSPANSNSSDLNLSRVTGRKSITLRNCPMIPGLDQVRILRGGNRIMLPQDRSLSPLRVPKNRFWGCGQDESGRTILFAKQRRNSQVQEIVLDIDDFSIKPINSSGTVQGRLQSKTANSVRVNGNNYFIDGSSRFFDYNEQNEVSLNFFNSRDCVEIEYYRRGSTRFIEKMEIEDSCGSNSNSGSGNNNSSGREIEVLGRITELTEQLIVLRGQSFTITDRTRFYDYDKANRVSLSFFRVGMCVDVEGRQTSSGLVADEVEFEDDCRS
jgi:hypothetical protein